MNCNFPIDGSTLVEIRQIIFIGLAAGANLILEHLDAAWLENFDKRFLELVFLDKAKFEFGFKS